jgi:hypothetical protein
LILAAAMLVLQSTLVQEVSVLILLLLKAFKKCFLIKMPLFVAAARNFFNQQWACLYGTIGGIPVQ